MFVPINTLCDQLVVSHSPSTSRSLGLSFRLVSSASQSGILRDNLFSGILASRKILAFSLCAQTIVTLFYIRSCCNVVIPNLFFLRFSCESSLIFI
jgi:hypothetical protein